MVTIARGTVTVISGIPLSRAMLDKKFSFGSFSHSLSSLIMMVWVLSHISCVELYDLTSHWYIVTISNGCIGNMWYTCSITLARNILAVPSCVLTTRVKGRGAPVGMAEDPNVEGYTSISFSCHIWIRIITNSDWLWYKWDTYYHFFTL